MRNHSLSALLLFVGKVRKKQNATSGCGRETSGIWTEPGIMDKISDSTNLSYILYLEKRVAGEIKNSEGTTLIGERLAQLRTMHNMTQEEFAEQLDVSRQAVSKWELDKTLPDVNKLLRISEMYQVSVDYLLKGTGETEPDETESDESNEEITGASLQSEEVVTEEKSTNEEKTSTEGYMEQNPDVKVKRMRAGLCTSLVLVSVLLLGSMALLARCLICQIWDKSDSEKALVKVEKLHAQYSLADVSGFGEDGVSVTKTVLLDTNGVRSGDYIYCYVNAAENKISVNYAVGTIIIIPAVSLALFVIWILLVKEVRRR